MSEGGAAVLQLPELERLFLTRGLLHFKRYSGKKKKTNMRCVLVSGGELIIQHAKELGRMELLPL